MAAMASKPEMPTFSYAQAAKGMSAAATAQQPAKSASTDQTKAVSRPDGSNPNPASHANPDTSSPQTEMSGDAEKAESRSDRESGSTVVGSQQPTAAGSSKNMTSGTTSPSVGTASTSTLPKEDDISVTANGSSDSTWDKQSQASVPAEKSNQAAEGSKEKSANASAEKGSSAPKELKAAPIPAVNVWQQRKEAQEAKAKANAALKPVVSTASKVGAAKSTSPASQTPVDSHQDPSKAGARKKADGTPEGVGSQMKDRKKADGGKGEGSRKAGFRYNRTAEGAADSAESTIPPVGDAASWPTPQTAQGEEKRKAQEKTEKAEKAEKSTTARVHGKEKWMPVPYVPTAVFSTPLPSAARRGGRPARGGRDGGRGGAHGATSTAGADKAASGQTAQSSAAKQTPSGHRGRNEPNAGRANSLPAQSRRSNSADAAASSEQRRASQAPERSRGDAARTKGAEEANASTEGAQTNGGENFSRYRQDSKPFGRNHESFAAQKGADHHPRNANGPGESHTGGRFSSSHERRFDNGPKSADFHRDSGFPKDRGEFHRDRDHQRERGDSRPERGRGGYRGRGGHSSYGGAQGQFPNPQFSQHSFVPHKSFSYGDRQRSQQQGLQNGTQPHNANHRMSLRSPSLPNTAPMYAPYPIPADINTMYAYPMHPGPMTAIPYQPYMEPFSLMSMLSMQLEYYFSVDNLCKDLFLRKHMDSQGWVPLSFIASFKRIKTLTEDFDLLRHVCRQLKNVEYQLGEDGVDRLRPRERWEQWVLSMEQRDPSARHDGPPPPKSQPANAEKPDENATPQGHVEGVPAPYMAPNGTVHDGSHAAHYPLPNGTGEQRVTGSKLSFTAPEFRPSSFVPVATQNENANVGKPNDDNTFPDDQVENLVIVVRKPGISSPPQPHFLNNSPRSFSNGSVDGCRTAGGTVTSEEQPFLPLNGGAANPTSMDENQLQQYGNMSSSLVTGGAVETGCQMPTFWVKDKDTPIEILSSDLVHESYSTFRKRALEKREKRDSTAANDGDRDMDVLYQFWSHFLVQNFNVKMYNEFRHLAFDDFTTRNSTNGLDSLIQFYDAWLSSNKTMPDEVASDLVTLVKIEPRSNGRPAFHKLRSAWQDGAFNLKNRKKIDRVLDDSLRAELEK